MQYLPQDSAHDPGKRQVGHSLVGSQEPAAPRIRGGQALSPKRPLPQIRKQAANAYFSTTKFPPSRRNQPNKAPVISPFLFLGEQHVSGRGQPCGAVSTYHGPGPRQGKQCGGGAREGRREAGTETRLTFNGSNTVDSFVYLKLRKQPQIVPQLPSEGSRPHPNGEGAPWAAPLSSQLPLQAAGPCHSPLGHEMAAAVSEAGMSPWDEPRSHPAEGTVLP